MENSAELRFAGDVNIEKIQIVASDGFYQDITNQVIGVQIFEDLFAPFITGSLVVRDSLDLVNLFPLVGEEFVDIKITTPSLNKGNVFEGRFFIYKLSNREMTGDRTTIYELHFISQESVVDMNKRVSKTFKGKCSEIAEQLLTDKQFGLQTEKKTNIEETTNDTRWISNFWSPVRNMNYLCGVSINKNESPSFVFFENRTGFNFTSLESLYSNNDYIQSFTYDNYIRDDLAGGGSKKNILKDFQRIREIHIPQVFDYMERSQNGMYASRQYSFDITSKNVDIRNYDMLKDDKVIRLNKFAPVSNKAIYRPHAMILTTPRDWGNFTGFGDASNAKILQKRLSLLRQADSSKVEIIVPGRLDYTVGQKVLLNLNKMEPIKKNEQDVTDKILSGSYVIGAINHFIDRQKHECTIELFKDSLMADLNAGNRT